MKAGRTASGVDTPPPTSSMAAARTDGPSEQNILVFYECIQNVYHDINHVDTKYAS